MIANAKLIGWGARVLYLGPALGLTPHRRATAVLAVALDGELEVADDPSDPNGAYRCARSVLIRPNTLHHLRIAGGSMAFLYVDPPSRDLDALRARMLDLTPRAAFNLINETAVIEVLTGLGEGRIAVRDARQALGELLEIGTRADTDVRIVAALRRYRLWNRMGASVRDIPSWNAPTEAAHAAGFASSAHFSAAFRDMFGMM